MMTHNGGMGGVSVRVREGARMEKDCIEGKEGLKGWGEGKNNRMNQTTLPYVNL